MKMRPLHPHAALLLEEGKRYVAVTDLHIGLEAEILEKGVKMPSLALTMATELLELIRKENAGGIMFLGDVKHSIGSISKQEWNEIPSFLKQLSEKADVYLVPGNHDANINQLVPSSVTISSAWGMALGDTLFVHGHSMPSEIRSNISRIVMGHVHPVFLKKGSVINGERVWIYLRGSKPALFPSQDGTIEVVVMPSFNPHLYATGVRGHRSISPIVMRLLEAGIERCIVATLDGSVVGDANTLPDML